MAGRGRDHRGADRVTSSPPLPPHIPGSSVRRDGGSFSRSSFHLDKSPHLCYNTPEAHRKPSPSPPLRARTGGLPAPARPRQCRRAVPRLPRPCPPDARLVWVSGSVLWRSRLRPRRMMRARLLDAGAAVSRRGIMQDISKTPRTANRQNLFRHSLPRSFV